MSNNFKQKNSQKIFSISKKLNKICIEQEFNKQFVLSSNTSFLPFSFNYFCNLIKQRLNNEVFIGGQFIIKILQISIFLLSFLLCLFIKGNYGERGICLLLSIFALFCSISIFLIKLFTLNCYLTPKHWFFMETSIYFCLCIFFSICSLMIAILNLPYFLIQGNNQRNDLAFIESFVLIICSGVCAIDVGCVYSLRLSKTWILSVSSYRV